MVNKRRTSDEYVYQVILCVKTEEERRKMGDAVGHKSVWWRSDQA